MIAAWLIYCVGVSLLLLIAAMAIDASLTARGRAARWVWAAAIAGSLVVPGAAYLSQRMAPPPQVPRGVNELGDDVRSRFPSRIIDAPHDRLEPVRAIVAHRPRIRELPGTERMAFILAIACIVIAGLRVIADSLLLYRQRRRWTSSAVDGEDVLLSDTLGPAIVGLLEPRIVLPRWTLDLAPGDRALMLAHEREHIRGHDGQLAAAALFAVVSMPWNPVVVYAFRRLRGAIEIDCDRRVLRAFPDIRRYGELLVDVAQRAAGSPFAIAGFSERATPVARRIDAMTVTRQRRHPARVLAAGAVGLVAAGGSLMLLPPEAPARTLDFQPGGPVTAAYVADSIARGDQPPTIVSAAQDLPEHFVADTRARIDAASADRSCPSELRDVRDTTVILKISMSATGIAGVVRRGDTAWTRLRSLGYYFVKPDGRYGVSVKRTETLRVGCGGLTRMTVGDRVVLPRDSVETLESNDARPRRIADAIVDMIHVRPLAVELSPQRLNVVIGDTTVVPREKDADWTFVHSVFARSRAVLLPAVMPETLAVSVRRSRNEWKTLYDYTSLENHKCARDRSAC